MNRIFNRLGFTAVAIVAGALPVVAQSTTTGSVSGVVRGANGAPLADATVRLASGQVTRTAVTAADGSFRFGLLNPGAWSIKVTKTGFQLFSTNVNVSTNSDQPVTVKMSPDGAATVEVIATAAAVDTTSTTQGLNMSLDEIASIPKARDFTQLAMLAPGVTTDSSFNGININGASAAENSFVLDGLVTTDFRSGFQGASMKTDFIDQFEVQTGGFRPEFSALGGVISAITKSGTNTMKGSAWLTWDAIGIQAVPKQTPYYIQAPANSRYDIGFEVSGPIIKDKLFYFIGVDSQTTESGTPLAPLDGPTDGTKAKTTDPQIVAKLNYYLTQDMQFTLFFNNENAKFSQSLARPNTGNANWGIDQTTKTQNINLAYDWNISPSLLFSAKFGTTDLKRTQSPADTAESSITDGRWYQTGFTGTGVGGGTTGSLANSGRNYSRGGYGLYDPLYEDKTTQFKADLSWFVGTHNVKLGVSQLTSKYQLIQAQTGPGWDGSTNGANAISYTLTSGGSLYTYEENTNATVKTVYTGYYIQDTWEALPGLRLMYGVRQEVQDLQDYAGKTFLKFSGSDYLQPRLGFTWDVNNDGKTKVAGSFATYFESVPQQISIRVFANEVYLRHRYLASQATSAGGTDWNYNNGVGNPTIINPKNVYATVDYATPFSYDPIADGTKLTQRKEYTLGVDHTLPSGWTVGLHGNYRRLSNVIEDSVLTDKYGSYYDSGLAYSFSGTGTPNGWAGQAILWNPGPGNVSWTARTGTVINGVNTSQNSGARINVPAGLNLYKDKAGNIYQSVDFTASKKTDRDYFNFSYVWSRLEGNYEGLVSSSNGQADANITASFDYFPYVGNGTLPLDHTNQIKLQWSHRFTVAGNDLNLGWNYSYTTGTPKSLFDDGSTTNGEKPGYDTAHVGAGNLVPNSATNPAGPGSHLFLDIGGYGDATPANGQLGQYGRTPALQNVDFHADYQLGLPNKLKIVPSVDVFNFFNTRLATSTNILATTNTGAVNALYGQESGWQVGRRFRFGVKVQF
jgi:hypothetical protein